MYYEKQIKDYLADLASNAHIPGGGSCVPILGALTNSISCFVINLSKNKKKYLPVQEELIALFDRAENLKTDFLPLIDKDNEILDEILSAYKNPEITESEMAGIIENSISFSLKICEMCIESLQIGLSIAKIKNKMLSSDIEIIAYIGEAALNSSISNIKINIGAVENEEYRENVRNKCIALQQEGEKLKKEIIEITDLHI